MVPRCNQVPGSMTKVMVIQIVMDLLSSILQNGASSMQREGYKF
jgi:hypothetical protein